MPEMPDHVRKQFEIRRKLDAIAPLGNDLTATDLARHLAVRAQERHRRMLDPRVAFDGQQIAAMCAEFAAAHALYALGDSQVVPSGYGAKAAAEIRDAWDDGGGIGEWLWEHLGRETAETVSALADELTETQAAVSDPDDEDLDGYNEARSS